MKNKKRINAKKQVLSSILGLTFSAILLGGGMQEAQANTLTAEWFDIPVAQRVGAPSAYFVDATKLENSYYKNLAADNKKLYLFKNNQSSTGFNSPVARGR